jgi:hypothetical protein
MINNLVLALEITYIIAAVISIVCTIYYLSVDKKHQEIKNLVIETFKGHTMIGAILIGLALVVSPILLIVNWIKKFSQVINKNKEEI